MSAPIYISGVRISPPQVVYVMANWGEDGLYKIGCSGNVLQRYAAKRSRDNIVHVIVVPDDMCIYDAERMVHEAFENKRELGYGEVFWLDDSDLKRLSRMFFMQGRLRERHGD